MSQRPRDPSTGQFVPQSAAEADRTSFGWSDFDHQHSVLRLQGQQDLAAGNTQFDAFESLEPLGGLARDEVAELVGVEITTLSKGDLQVDNAGTVGYRVEVSLDSTSQLSFLDLDGDNDRGGITGFDPGFIQIVDPDILWSYTIAATAGFEDTLNGTSAGPTDDLEYRTIPFRSIYGEGPVMDRHDEIFWHIFIFTPGGAPHEIVEDVHWVWDVRTGDRR